MSLVLHLVTMRSLLIRSCSKFMIKPFGVYYVRDVLGPSLQIVQSIIPQSLNVVNPNLTMFGLCVFMVLT